MIGDLHPLDLAAQCGAQPIRMIVALALEGEQELAPKIVVPSDRLLDDWRQFGSDDDAVHQRDERFVGRQALFVVDHQGVLSG